VRQRKGDFKGAIEDFSSGLRVDPLNAVLYEKRGDARLGINDYEGASKDFQRALNVAPPNWPDRAEVEQQLRSTLQALQKR
jgi:tetratricopeptide (TPR) repeat protein